MSIIKTMEEVTFKKLTVQHTLEVNGKEVRVYEHTEFDQNGYDDYDYNVDEEDRKELTDDEYDELMDELPDLLKS